MVSISPQKVTSISTSLHTVLGISTGQFLMLEIFSSLLLQKAVGVDRILEGT